MSLLKKIENCVKLGVATGIASILTSTSVRLDLLDNFTNSYPKHTIKYDIVHNVGSVQYLGSYYYCRNPFIPDIAVLRLEGSFDDKEGTLTLVYRVIYSHTLEPFFPFTYFRTGINPYIILHDGIRMLDINEDGIYDKEDNGTLEASCKALSLVKKPFWEEIKRLARRYVTYTHNKIK